MTKYIGEPNIMRRPLVAEWGVRQLFRRPAPVLEAAGAGELPWARVSKRGLTIVNQAFPSGSEQTVTWRDEVNDYPEYFDTDLTSHEIGVLQDGFYSMTARVFFSQWPGSNYIAINGIDPDAEGGYAGSADAISAHIKFTLVHVDARLAAGQAIYLTAYHEFGSDRNIFGDGGTYMEIRRIGDATTNDREATFA